MKNILLILLLLLILLQNIAKADTYVATMKLLLSEGKPEEAFYSGFSRIKELRKINSRNHDIDFLTWASLSACNDKQASDKGLQVLGDYLKFHKTRLTNSGLYNSYIKIFFLLKNRETPINQIYFITQDESKTILVHQAKEVKRGGRVEGNFKTYMNYKEAADLRLYVRLNTNRKFNKNVTEIKNITEIKQSNSKPYELRAFDHKAPVPKIDSIISNRFIGSRHIIGENFIIISNRFTQSDLALTLQLLEKTLAYYKKTLDIEQPKNYITVFLSNDYYDVTKDIRRIYGDTINKYILGYTNPKSFGIVAWLPSAQGVGTIKHELIHLLLHNQFSLCPHWIEEGIATLFEESFFSGDELAPQGNWRGTLLNSLDRYNLALNTKLFRETINRTGNDTPEEISASNHAIRSLVRNELRNLRSRTRFPNRHYDEQSWRSYKESDLDLAEEELTQEISITANDAMARYILLYLYSSGKLNNLYHLLKSNEDDIEQLKYYSINELLVQASGSDNYIDFESKFLTWLKTAPKQ